MKPIPCDARPRPFPARLPQWCMLLGLFLLICGAKFWLINHYGNATPYWDEWISELRMIKAYLEGTISPALYFQSHNEHRIVYSQLLLMTLFHANGQWDPILQMVAQAPLHAIGIVAFVCLAGKSMDNLGRAAVAGLAGCVSILPFGWENTLWGDQSCFYFSMLFAIVVIWLCWRHEALTPRWWLGALLGFASLFALANGTFSIVAIAAFLTARLAVERGPEWKRRLAGVAILGAIAAFGVAITPHLTTPNELVAKSFRDFFWALTGVLSWPCTSHWACIIIQAPIILLAFACVFRRVPFNDGRWYVIILGAFFWIQALATAYRRCQGWSASRYCDSWGMLLIIIGSCLCLLPGAFAARRRFLLFPLAAVWLGTCLYGMLDGTMNLLPPQLKERRSTLMEMENNVREYLSTGNPVWLQGKIPFSRPAMLQQILDMKSIRAVLPSNLINPNPPLSPATEKSASGGFVQNGYAGGVPALDKASLGSYGKSSDQSKNGITLQFKVPQGTRQVDLQVAGYPNARGIALKVEEHAEESRSIAPPFDPGDNWQTVSVRLNPKSTSFKISAKDGSDHAWIAFSMPTVCNDHVPGRWARSLLGDSLAFIDSGLVLLLIGGLAGIANRKIAGEASDPCLDEVS